MPRPHHPQQLAYPQSPPNPPTEAPRRRPVVSRWFLTAALTLHAVVALAQPVLIGGYLDGNFDLVTVHGINGSLLMTCAFLAAVTAVVYWAAGGRGWPALAVAGVWCAEFVQLVLGYTRVLSVHVALGVLIVGSAISLAVWSWSRACGRARQGWWR
jgi:hypothetical protein